jgi:hypothetical protein
LSHDFNSFAVANKSRIASGMYVTSVPIVQVLLYVLYFPTPISS